MSTDFFKDLKGFSQFSELTKPSYYTPAPADWYAVVTDITNSTQAIDQGRYKEVNLVGAAGIMAILNIAGEIAVPYAFGGDGSTMLIPPEMLDKVQQALSAVRTKVQMMFDMELRAGCVPLQALYDQGMTLGVAKFHLSPHVSQAVFQGDALGLAEKWLKKGGGTVLRCELMTDKEPNYEGLECRWQPIENRNGEMLSLLVKVTPAHTKDAWRFYAEILKEIEKIYPESAQSNPVHLSRLRISLSPSKLKHEVNIRGGNTFMSKALYFIKIMILNCVGRYAFATGKSVGNFNGERYLSEMVANSDTKKFDEMLRMVLDSSPKQHEKLEKLLVARQQKGEITYGIHVSSQALMTCLVFNLSGNHVHFIDGADGGYALAARQMKQQSAPL